jgi:inosose dehydratase
MRAMKLAAAPISWGVCEVPGWGLQLTAERVLGDMAALDFAATEAGPPGFLPEDAGAARRLLDPHELSVIGGFVTAVLHDRGRRSSELAALERQARWLAALGGELLVLAPATGRAGHTGAAELEDEAWRTVFEGLDRAAEVAERHRLAMTVHPHWGTVIERRHHVGRFLEGCAHALCLDTGHVALGGADPVTVARAAGARVRHVHLKDVDGDLAEQVRASAIGYDDAVRRGLYVPLGRGAARIGDVVALLGSSGYRGWYVLEQDVMLDQAPGGPPAWIRESLGFLGSISASPVATAGPALDPRD